MLRWKKGYLHFLLALGPITGGSVIMPLLGQCMGIVFMFWVLGSLPQGTSRSS